MRAIFLIVALLLFAECSTNYFIRYDQFAETLFLFKYFYDVTDGYFVDIGAYDPMALSNTLFLYNQGWMGVNV